MAFTALMKRGTLGTGPMAFLLLLPMVYLLALFQKRWPSLLPVRVILGQI